jgi:hypothetical protein
MWSPMITSASFTRKYEDLICSSTWIQGGATVEFFDKSASCPVKQYCPFLQVVEISVHLFIKSWNMKYCIIHTIRFEINSWFSRCTYLLKGIVYRDFRPSVFSPINPPWVTDYHPKIFPNLVLVRPDIREYVCATALRSILHNRDSFLWCIAWRKFDENFTLSYIARNRGWFFCKNSVIFRVVRSPDTAQCSIAKSRFGIVRSQFPKL